MSWRSKEALKNLCCNNGWSYAVLWRVNPPNSSSMLLSMEDTYFEGQMGMIINDMLQHIHILAKGITGRIALTGKHKWIFSDNFFGECSANNQDVFQDNPEFRQQFSSGIKTIALISVAPQGVVQLGSTHKIMESLDFVDHIKDLFQQLESANGVLLGHVPTALNHEIYDQRGTESFIFSSGSSCSNYGSNKSSHDSRGKELMGKNQCALVIPQLSPINLGYQNGNINSSTGYSFQLKNQFQTDGSEAQVILARPNIQTQQSLSQVTSGSDNSTTRNPMIGTWRSTEGSTMTSSEQQILSGMRMHDFKSALPTNSQTLISCRNPLHNFQGPTNLTSCGTSVLPNTATITAQVEVKKPVGYNSGKLVDVQVSAPFDDATEGEILQGSTTFHSIPGEPKPTADRAALSKSNAVDNLPQWVPQSVERSDAVSIALLDENLSRTLGIAATSPRLVGGELFSGTPVTQAVTSGQDPLSDNMNPLNVFFDGNEKFFNAPMQLPIENDLFGSFCLDFGKIHGKEPWDDILLATGSGSGTSLSTGASECISELDVGSMSASQKGFFTDFSLEQLLEGVFSNANSDTRPSSGDQVSTATIGRARRASECSNHVQLAGLSCLGGTTDDSLPECKLDDIMHRNPNESGLKSRVSSWIDDSYSISSASAASAAVMNPKRSDELAKTTKKRARPGESTRPRPKDRQQIQDRVKELREIVPNGAKCSIDALLDRTIKSMLFMQSVAKHADKLTQADEPKMVGNENGVVLKDNSNGGGATWAFEVGCQTMVCPILVEDLSPPGQMLIEMLCEESGYFLEIADIIRGFGLTILKGLMEVRGDKVWARFIVEANRNNITRMDIFLSLVQLLQQTTGISSNSPPTRSVEGQVPMCTNYQQSPMPLQIADQLH